MILITKEINARLLANWQSADDEGKFPVVKLFTPWANCTWLITERDPEDPDLLFGLCDLGTGFPELGYVSLSELESVTGPAGLKIERDIHFTPKKSLRDYAAEAHEKQRICA